MSDTKRGRGNPSTDFDGRPLWQDSDKPPVDAVERIAKERGVSMATIALAWVLKNPGAPRGPSPVGVHRTVAVSRR